MIIINRCQHDGCLVVGTRLYFYYLVYGPCWFVKYDVEESGLDFSGSNVMYLKGWTTFFHVIVICSIDLSCLFI